MTSLCSAGFITFGKITLETKELRVLLAGKKPEADRLVKLFKAVKSANPQSALTHEAFECCHPCRHRRPAAAKDLVNPTLKRKLETQTEATRRQVCTHSPILDDDTGSRLRYCNSSLRPRPGARKDIHQDASLHRAHPQSRPTPPPIHSSVCVPPLTAEDTHDASACR